MIGALIAGQRNPGRPTDPALGRVFARVKRGFLRHPHVQHLRQATVIGRGLAQVYRWVTFSSWLLPPSASS
jgi:hypothetical protein